MRHSARAVTIRLRRCLVVLAAAFSVVLLASSNAYAFPSVGGYAQLHCRHSGWFSNVKCGSVPAHSWDHWVQSRIDCKTAGSSYYQVIDAHNGVVVDSGSCSFFGGTSFKYTVGLYGLYDVKVWGGAADVTIRNCTSCLYDYEGGG